jgi:CheY-like chemotaxis protein
MSDLENSQIKVLLVDDEPDVLEGFKEYLEELYEYSIDTATNANDALERLSNESFEIVITDMRMEKNDSGFDVLDAVNKNQLTTFVIILTANSSVKGCRKAWKHQAWDYISKTDEEKNPLDEVHESIQEVMSHLKKWDGHLEDKNWVEQNIEELSKEYINQYIAVLHREVVAFSDTKLELVAQLLKRKISPYLAYTESFKLEVSDEKVTVFVEGPTDIKYLEKAIEIFGRDDLKEKIIIDTVGDKTGQKNNGEQNMKNAFAFLQENPERRGKNGILFLFDNDIKDKALPNKGKVYENMHIDRMGEYLDNHQGVKGVESFFSVSLYEEGLKKGFIQKTIKQKYCSNVCDEESCYKIIDKAKFCEWVIVHRADEKTFMKFKGILEVIDDFLEKLK